MQKIAPALVKARRAFGKVLKDKNNPHFKSKYADLSACIDAVDDACLDAGLVVYQETSPDDSGITIETVFLHESGEALRCGKLHVPAAKNDPQGFGSALTYARRYSLLTACGLAAEDDDGNAATTATQSQSRPQAATKEPALRTIAMKARERIQQALADGKDMTAVSEYEACWDHASGEELSGIVWNGLTTPERKALTALLDAARAKAAA